jgi:ATP-dependent Zn protease
VAVAPAAPVRDSRLVPWFWTKMANGPNSHEKREHVRRIVREAGGRLAEDELFFSHDSPTACALIHAPNEKVAKAIAERLGAHEQQGLFSTDEKAEVDKIGEGLR